MSDLLNEIARDPNAPEDYDGLCTHCPNALWLNRKAGYKNNQGNEVYLFTCRCLLTMSYVYGDDVKGGEVTGCSGYDRAIAEASKANNDASNVSDVSDASNETEIQSAPLMSENNFDPQNPE